MEKGLQFLENYELKNVIMENKEREIVVWGIGHVSELIKETLQSLAIQVSYYGDSNLTLRGSRKDSIVILAPEDMQGHLDAIVIIACFGYLPIYKMLKGLGVEKIYALLDVYKYSFQELLADNSMLQEYFVNYSVNRTDKILLELYGNIGDVILRMGIVKAFIKRYGTDNVYLLFSEERSAELYRIVTKHIIVLEEQNLSDVRLRQEKLSYINSLYFAKTVILCDVRLLALKRILNVLNSNITEVIYCDSLPEQEYLIDIDISCIKKYFDGLDEKALYAEGALTGAELPDSGIICTEGKYVCVHLGASQRARQYNPEQFVEVIKHIIVSGYQIVFLGHGPDDEVMFQRLKMVEDISAYIIDGVSKFSLVEVAKILYESEFFVGTDSGIWNLSYILGKKSVVLYGGGEYGCFKHPSPNIKYVSVEDRDCFGCKWYCNQKDAEGRARCIYEISSSEIIKAMDELIRELK